MHILFPYLARYKAVNWTRYHHLFGQLAKMGHRITILQPPPADLNETNFQEIEVDLPDNIKLIDVKMPGWLWNHTWPKDKLVKKGSYGLLCRSEVARIMKEDPPDALIVYNLPQAGLLQVPPAPGRGLVRIFDLADDYEAMLKTELGKAGFGLLLRYGRRKLIHMLNEADLVLSISRALIDDYPDYDIGLLPNGVDFERFETVRKGLIPREANGGRRPVIGYLGAFEYFIDFEMIFGTARLLPECHFRLVGGGRLESWIKNRIVELRLDNVEVPGSVPFTQVPAEIGSWDICLNLFERIPISHKASPMKLFEYLAMGKPVLTTSLDEVERYQMDFLQTVNTPEEAAAAITSLMADDSVRWDIEERGRNWVQEVCDWRDLANRLVEMIENTASRMR
ncbi:MAG: glycosyltransferase family 4 protein [bacterium]|nr:glycosyltransferase family 4 protein [bacterium]